MLHRLRPFGPVASCKVHGTGGTAFCDWRSAFGCPLSANRVWQGARGMAQGICFRKAPIHLYAIQIASLWDGYVETQSLDQPQPHRSPKPFLTFNF
jgi:hypothetical protein